MFMSQEIFRTRRRKWPVILIVVVVAICGLNGAPAGASTDTQAFTSCVQGATRDIFQDVRTTVQGNAFLPQAPLARLERGDIVRVTATGIINTGGWSGSHDPNGSPDLAPGGIGSLWPAVGMRKYSLFGQWGHDGVKFVSGTDSGCLDYSAVLDRFGTGQDTIHLGINDEDIRDNTGSFDVRIRVWRNPSMTPDGGFEQQPRREISWPWMSEGPDYKGIDIDLGLANSGRKNGFIRTSSTNWNALTVWSTLVRNKPYRLQGFIRTSANFNNGFFGVRASSSTTVLAQTRFGSFTPAGYQQFTVDFNPGPNDYVTVFVGYFAPGYDSWVQMDDISVRRI